MTEAQILAVVKRATARRLKADADWTDAIRAAHAAGVTTRKIGEAAGVSHVRVQQIARSGD